MGVARSGLWAPGSILFILLTKNYTKYEVTFITDSQPGSQYIIFFNLKSGLSQPERFIKQVLMKRE